MLRRSGLRLHGLWLSRLRCHGLWRCVLLRWHHPSISHHPVSQQLCTSRRYSRQASLPGWESLLTPPLTRLLPLVVKVWKAMRDRALKVKTIPADLPVTPGERERSPPSGRPISRHLARWVSTPPGHLPTFPQLQHLKVPCPNMAVVQELHLATLKRGLLNTGVLGGRRTLNIPSKFTTDMMSPPSRRWNGQR